MNSLWNDLRYGYRVLAKTPGFTFTALVTLAIAIGANTAMFTALNAVLLRALPYRNPERLVIVWERNDKLSGIIKDRVTTNIRNFARWKSDSHSFDALVAYDDRTVNITGTDKPETIEASRVTTDFFPMLGVTPAIGRAFAANDALEGNNHVVMLSWGIYERRFGRDAGIVGRTIDLDGARYTIIGVLPQPFHLSAVYGGLDQKKPEVWLPLNLSLNQKENVLNQRNLFVIGRLKSGVSIAQGNSEMDIIEARLEKEFPKINPNFHINIQPVRAEDVGSDLRLAMLILQFAVAFVLLIACANVANLMLARAAARESEIVVRVALGAGRWRLVRQMLTESLLLSIAGGAAGILLAWWSISALASMAPGDIARLHDLRIDPMVLGFTAAVIIITGTLFGMAPAFHAARQHLNESLNRAGRTGSARISGRLRSILVISEISMAMMLLVGAGLMIRTLRAYTHAPLGFRADHVLVAGISLPESRYADRTKRLAFDNELLQRVSALPGVQSATIVTGLPMNDLSISGYKLPGEHRDEKEWATAQYRDASEQYLQTLGIPLLSGRNFNPEEATAEFPHAIIVNQEFARRVFPNQEPLGKVILMGRSEKKDVQRENVIVGVMANSVQLSPALPQEPEVLFPDRGLQSMQIAIRTSSDPMDLAPALSSVVHGIDPDQPLRDVQPFQKIVYENNADERFMMTLLVAFAGVALLLAAVGIYGVLAYAVEQRTREIGIRMALGAQTRDLLRHVFAQGARMAAIGLAIGVLAALGGSRLMEDLLFGVKPADTVTFTGVVILLALVALLASWIPARRATKVDPMVALRCE